MSKSPIILIPTLGLLCLCFTTIHSQQLNFTPVAPYEEFKAHDIDINNNGELHLISPRQDEIYKSFTGESWFIISTGNIEGIEAIHFFDNDEMVIESNLGLHAVVNSNWELIYESKTSTTPFDAKVNNDIIYVMDEGVISSSTNRGTSFSQVYQETDPEFYLAKIEATDNYVYYYSNNSITVLDQNFSFVKNNAFDRRGILIALTFLDISDDDIIIYGTQQSDGLVEPTGSQNVFFTSDQGDSFRSILGGSCQQYEGGVVIGDDLIISNADHDLMVYNINTGITESMSIELAGSFLFNQETLYLYNEYSINELIDYKTGEVRKINPNATFQSEQINSFRVSRSGQLYTHNGYNLFHSSDGGLSWNKLELDDQEVLNFDLGSDNSLHIVTPEYYYYSSNDGQNFTRNEHDLFITNANQGIYVSPRVYAFDGSTTILALRGCQGLSGPAYFSTDNQGLTWSNTHNNIGFANDFYSIGGQLYGYGTNGIIQLDNSLRSTDLNPDLPKSTLIVDENLFHYNERFNANLSYVSRDLGVTTEKLTVGPGGLIYKAEEYEGTYVHNRTQLYKRPSVSDVYQEIDVSAIEFNTYGFTMESDFQGNIYILDNIYQSSKLYRVDNNLTHAQEIKGNIFYDENGDCSYDANETIEAAAWKIQIENADYNLTNFSNDGSFSFKVPKGTYTLTVISPSERWTACQTSYQVEVLQDNETVIQDIGVQTEMLCSDFSVTINNHILRRCIYGRYDVDIQNTGTSLSQNTTATITVDPLLEITDANLPYQVVNDTTILFDLGSMEVLEKEKLIVHVIPDCNSELGHVHCFDVTMASDDLCSDSSTSSKRMYEPNIGSYDPNDMRVFSESGHQALQYGPDDYQYYHVRFQNVGTDTAFNVKSISTIDPNLDVSTLELLGSSHSYLSSLNDGQNLVMTFENIMLPDSTTNNPASNGYYRFRIKPNRGIELGTELNCNTDIYFDFNPAVRTNTTSAVIGVPCESPTYTYEKVDICYRETYEDYSRTGIYEDILLDDDGCDYIRILDLTVLFNSGDYIRKDACQGQVVDGYDSNILVVDSLLNYAGCDSIVRTQYRFLPLTNTTVQEFNNFICEGDNLYGHTTPGTYLDTVPFGSNCRIFLNNLEVFPSYEESIDVDICEGESFNGYTESGTYTEELLTAAHACDSTIIVNLNVIQSAETFLDTLICEGEDYMGLTETGEYVFTEVGPDGCDDIFTLNLTVIPLSEAPCLSATQELLLVDSVQIYPNPAKDIVTIKSEQDFNSVELINLEGKKVLSQKWNNEKEKQLDLSGIDGGLYLIKIESDKGVVTKKLVID